MYSPPALLSTCYFVQREEAGCNSEMILAAEFSLIQTLTLLCWATRFFRLRFMMTPEPNARPNYVNSRVRSGYEIALIRSAL